MAVYDLEEQEQLENLKSWWRQHGNRIVNVLLVVVIAAGGWMGWRYYQKQQSASASVVFDALQQAVTEQDGPRALAAAGELRENFGGTTYAVLGTLLTAKSAFESGDLKSARVQLDWAVANSKNELRDLARLQQAVVMADDKALDEALKALEQKPVPALAAAYAELRGDILVAQGKPDEARKAYEAALEKPAAEKGSTENAGTEKPASENPVLRIKLDALGEGSSS